MSTILLSYFSGTGNTKLISEKLKEDIEEAGSKLTLLSMESLYKSYDPIAVNNYDMLGLSYPIYGFGTPQIVYDFVEKLPETKGQKVFIFKTGADYISINHNASGKLIKQLKKKGYSVFYDRIFLMPSNFLLGYRNEINVQISRASLERVKHMCGEILKQIGRTYKTGILLKYISYFIALLEGTYGSKYFGRSLRTGENCNECGVCADNCPTENISMGNKKPVFGDNCLFCMRCIYNCTENAIYSKNFNFCVLKDGYSIENIIENEKNGDHYLTDKTRGYYRHFYKYLKDISL